MRDDSDGLGDMLQSRVTLKTIFFSKHSVWLCVLPPSQNWIYLFYGWSEVWGGVEWKYERKYLLMLQLQYYNAMGTFLSFEQIFITIVHQQASVTPPHHATFSTRFSFVFITRPTFSFLTLNLFWHFFVCQTLNG